MLVLFILTLFIKTSPFNNNSILQNKTLNQHKLGCTVFILGGVVKYVHDNSYVSCQCIPRHTDNQKATLDRMQCILEMCSSDLATPTRHPPTGGKGRCR